MCRWQIPGASLGARPRAAHHLILILITIFCFWKIVTFRLGILGSKPEMWNGPTCTASEGDAGRCTGVKMNLASAEMWNEPTCYASEGKTKGKKAAPAETDCPPLLGLLTHQPCLYLHIFRTGFSYYGCSDFRRVMMVDPRDRRWSPINWKGGMGGQGFEKTRHKSQSRPTRSFIIRTTPFQPPAWLLNNKYFLPLKIVVACHTQKVQSTQVQFIGC